MGARQSDCDAKLATLVRQILQRVVARRPLDSAEIKADEGQGGAVTLIQALGRRPLSTFICTASC